MLAFFLRTVHPLVVCACFIILFACVVNNQRRSLINCLWCVLCSRLFTYCTVRAPL